MERTFSSPKKKEKKKKENKIKKYQEQSYKLYFVTFTLRTRVEDIAVDIKMVKVKKYSLDLRVLLFFLPYCEGVISLILRNFR